MHPKALRPAIANPLETLESRRLFAASMQALAEPCDDPTQAPMLQAVHVEAFHARMFHAEPHVEGDEAFASGFSDALATQQAMVNPKGDWMPPMPTRPHTDASGAIVATGEQAGVLVGRAVQIELPTGEGEWTIVVSHEMPASAHDMAGRKSYAAPETDSDATPPAPTAGGVRTGTTGTNLGPAYVPSPSPASVQSAQQQQEQTAPPIRTSNSDAAPAFVLSRASAELPTHAQSASRDQAGTEVQVQTVADGRAIGQSNRTANDQPAAQARMAILPDAQAAAPQSAAADVPQDRPDAAPAVSLVALARTLAGPVAAVGRVLGNLAQPGAPTGSPEIGQWTGVAQDSFTLLGLAPIRMLSTEETGNGWRITAGVSLVVTAFGYWYCQTNPMQVRKRKGRPTVIAAGNPGDRDCEFPAVT